MKKTTLMKKITIILVVCLALVVACGATVGVLAMSNRLWFQKDEPTDAYVFPVTPKGSPEAWSEFQTHDEMTAACQIPEDLLASMSTYGLVETCISYPLFADMFLYNTSLEGFDSVCRNFNGLKELLERPDAGVKLAALYKDSEFSKISSTDTSHALRYDYFCYMLSNDKVLQNMSVEVRQQLLNECVNSITEIVENYSKVYSILPSFLIAARISAVDNPAFVQLMEQNAIVKHFVERGELQQFSQELVDEILALWTQGGVSND